MLERFARIASFEIALQLAESLQRLGHENCRTCFLLQGVALKTCRLIHANRLMIFVDHLQRQLTTTKFLCLSFDRLQQLSPNAFAARRW
jgi:hypothetical protein